MLRIAESLAFGLFLLIPSAAAGQEASGIEKFFRVNKRVCTGAQPTKAQLAALKDEGIRAVINLREPQEYDAAEEAAEVRALGLTYVHIPVKTADPKEEQLEAFLRTTRDPKIFPVFIHCGSGNRVGAFWLVRRVLVDGWTVEDAEKEAKQIGLRSSNLREFALDYIRRRGEKASVPGSPDGPRVGGLWDEPPSSLQARLRSFGLADLSKAEASRYLRN